MEQDIHDVKKNTEDDDMLDSFMTGVTLTSKQVSARARCVCVCVRVCEGVCVRKCS